MKATIWILSTTIPDDPEPCWPRAFGTLAEAQAAFLEAMQNEWATNGARDDDTGDVLPFPTTDDGKPDAEEAHSQMVEADESGEWGRWEVTSHEIELPEPPVPAPVDPPAAPDGMQIFEIEICSCANIYSRGWIAAKDADEAMRIARDQECMAPIIGEWREETGDAFDSDGWRVYAPGGEMLLEHLD